MLSASRSTVDNVKNIKLKQNKLTLVVNHYETTLKEKIKTLIVL